MFLSPHHEVVKFKTTNVYLNRMIVKPRLQDNLDTVFTAKGMAEEEAMFNKDRSVFAPYVEVPAAGDLSPVFGSFLSFES